MSPEHGVFLMMSSFWQTFQANRGYFGFWITVMAAAVLTFVVPVWWELHKIRLELQRSNEIRLQEIRGESRDWQRRNNAPCNAVDERD